MKQIKIALLGIFLIIILPNLDADGFTTTRNKCKSGYPYSDWRWSATSKTWCATGNNPAQKATNRTCSSAGTGLTSAFSGNGPSVWQNTINGPSGSQIWGATYKRTCGRGYPYSDLFLSTNEIDTTGREGHNISHAAIYWDSTVRKIFINDINGYFNNSFSYIESQFKVTIWLPVDNSDSVISSGKIKWEGTISILNGVVTSSNFSLGTEYSTNSDSGKTVLLNNFDKEINLSFLTNEDFDNIVVTMSSHTIDRTDEYEEFLVNLSDNVLSTNNITLNFSKKPESDELRLEFIDNFSSQIKIEIFELNGKRIYNYILKTLQKGSFNDVIKLKSPTTSIVFIRIETEDNKVIYRKLILN